MSEDPKRLYRSRDERMLLGVCGGLGEYFDVDPTLVRIVYVLFTLFTAVVTGVIVYLILVIIMPDEDKAHLHPKVAARATLDEGVAGTKDAATRATGWVQQQVSGTTPTSTDDTADTGGTAATGAAEEAVEADHSATSEEESTGEDETESRDDPPPAG